MSGSCSGERTCTVTTTRKHVCNVMISHTCRASCLNSVLTRSCQVSPACRPISPLGRLNSLDPPWEWPRPAAPTQTAACCARKPRPDPCPSAPPGWQSAASRAGPASKGGQEWPGGPRLVLVGCLVGVGVGGRTHRKGQRSSFARSRGGVLLNSSHLNPQSSPPVRPRRERPR